jgi:hypothetical protein
LDVAGVPLGIVQLHDVGLLVELSVSAIDCPSQLLVEAVKFAAGGLPLEYVVAAEVFEHPNVLVTTSVYDPLEVAV